MMKVPKELRSIWQYCEQIFCQAPGPGTQQLNTQKSISVNWSQVNFRAFSNLPKPQDIPLHGCHKDPNNYRSWHESSYPFGSVPGFKTSLGIICCDAITEPIHGFIYNKEMGGWVIHANYNNKEKDVNFNKLKQVNKKQLKKKTGSTPIRRRYD